MNRQPVYHKENPHLRVISRPNGQWQAQKFSGGKGSKTCDPWTALYRATDFMSAKAQVDTAAKARP